MTDQLAAPEAQTTRCCIAGGGPAGMMLGFLLARAGVDVVVLEKHGDFLRDFRGDTIHPSTLQVMYELGLLDEFLKRPHNQASYLRAHVGPHEVMIADMRHLPTRCKFIALMPQWDFLNFVTEHARRYPTFHLQLQTEVVDVIAEEDRVVGIRGKTPQGTVDIRADLIVGADGRHSIVRQKAGLVVHDLGAPIDVLWMRLPRHASDPSNPLGYFDRGKVLVLLDRAEYWQCAFVIPKGTFEEVRQRGMESFRSDLAEIAPFLADRVGELKDWDQIKLLTVRVDRLEQWYRPGLLCIGDAAHAMSPIGGVGINLAIQDAIATANLLAEPLHRGVPTSDDLKRVQRRREFPTRVTQRFQIIIQNRVISRVLASQRQLRMPWILRMVRRFPILARIPARLVGLGIRPEHIHTPDAFATK
jgi:2-polyprenyl-6-methoxyphenol hydroxylase-like FAD-dependent oxidoreductase